MKNSLTRKLLLAVITLGIAVIATVGSTYAWFSMNTTVEATGMQLTATTPVNVVISKDANTGFQNSITFDSETLNLYPASTDKTLLLSNGTYTFWAVEEGQVIGENGEGGISSTATKFQSSAITTESVGNPAKNYVIAEDIYLKTTAGKISLYLEEIMLADFEGEVDSHAVESSATVGSPAVAKNIYDAIYVALLTDHGTFIYQATGGSGNHTGVLSVSSQGVRTLGSQYAFTQTNNTGDEHLIFNSNVEGAELGTTAEKVTVLVWLEGEDVDCVNAIGGLGVNIGLKFAYKEGSFKNAE